MPEIHFNGKTYNDIAEMPATERQAYEQLMEIFKDEDQDGTPDFFQGDVIGKIINVVIKNGADSDQIAALEQLSPEMRARISKGIAKLQELGFLSEVPVFTPGPRAPSWEDAEIRPSRPIIQSPSAIQEDTGPRWGVLILMLLGLLILGFGAAYFFLFGT